MDARGFSRTLLRILMHFAVFLVPSAHFGSFWSEGSGKMDLAKDILRFTRTVCAFSRTLCAKFQGSREFVEPSVLNCSYSRTLCAKFASWAAKSRFDQKI